MFCWSQYNIPEERRGRFHPTQLTSTKPTTTFPNSRRVFHNNTHSTCCAHPPAVQSVRRSHTSCTCGGSTGSKVCALVASQFRFKRLVASNVKRLHNGAHDPSRQNNRQKERKEKKQDPAPNGGGSFTTARAALAVLVDSFPKAFRSIKKVALVAIAREAHFFFLSTRVQHVVTGAKIVEQEVSGLCYLLHDVLSMHRYFFFVLDPIWQRNKYYESSY